MSSCVAPLTVMEPVRLSFGLVMGTRPASALSRLVFPEPLGPMSASSFPGSSLPLMPSRMTFVSAFFSLVFVSTV